MISTSEAIHAPCIRNVIPSSMAPPMRGATGQHDLLRYVLRCRRVAEPINFCSYSQVGIQHANGRVRTVSWFRRFLNIHADF